MVHIASSPYFQFFYKLPLFPQNLQIFLLFSFNLRVCASPYFDHDLSYFTRRLRDVPGWLKFIAVIGLFANVQIISLLTGHLGLHTCFMTHRRGVNPGGGAARAGVATPRFWAGGVVEVSMKCYYIL